jgi:hypothetical protein
VTLGGKGNQHLVRRVDDAARHLGRARADLLRIMAEDWLAAWEASGGAAREEPLGSRSRPLLGHRVPFVGAEGGGLIVPFRPRLVMEPET